MRFVVSEANKKVIGDPDGVEPNCFGESRHCQDVRPSRRAPVHHALGGGQDKTDLQGTQHRGG